MRRETKSLVSFRQLRNPVAAAATKRQRPNSRGQRRTSSIASALAVAVTRFGRILLILALQMSAVSYWMLNGTASVLLAELLPED